MASRILTATADYSTSAGSWRHLDFLNWYDNYGVYYWTTVPTTGLSSQNITLTNGVSEAGVVLQLRRDGTTGTFVVYLDEYITGAWSLDKAHTAAINVSSLGVVNNPYYFTFTAPYTATTNPFRLRIVPTNNSQISWQYPTATGTYYLGIVDASDDVNAPTAGDTMILAQSVVLTQDQSVTAGPTNGASIILSNESKWQCLAPAGAYTLALGAGGIFCGANSHTQFGTDDANRIASANKFSITSSLANTKYLFIQPNTYTQNFAGTGTGTHKWYGAYTDTRLHLDADAAANQGVVTTVEDIPAEWTAGDVIKTACKDQMAIDTRVYSIKSTGAKSVTLNESRTATTSIASPCVVTITAHNLTDGDGVVFSTTGALPTGITAGTTYYARSTAANTFNIYDTAAHAIAGGATGRIDTSGTQSGVHTCVNEARLDTKLLSGGTIHNSTRAQAFGINLINTGGDINFMGVGNYGCYTIEEFDVSGVYHSRVAITPVNSSLNHTVLYKHIVSEVTSNQNAPCSLSSLYGGTFDDINYFCTSGFYGSALTLESGTGSLGNSYSHITMVGTSTSGAATILTLNGTNHTVNDVVFANCATYTVGIWTGGTGHTITDVVVIGGSVANQSSSTIWNNLIQKRSSASGLYLYSGSDVTFNNPRIGYDSPNTTSDIKHMTNTLSKVTMYSPMIGALGVDPNFKLTLNGTFLLLDTYNGTVGDHRSWKTYGKFTTDSPYTNLRQETSSASLSLSHQFKLLSQTIATKKHYLVSTGQINDAAYYGGTHTDPTIDIYADADTTTPLATLVFNDSDTSAHTKSIDFTPTTSNNQVILDFLTKTAAVDNKGICTMTNANPCVVTYASHGFNANDPIVFSTAGTLPSHIVAGTVYYVNAINASTFNISATPGGANISTNGDTNSGTHFVRSTRGDVLWSNAKIVQRIYGQTYTSQDLGISETLTYPIATLTTPVANPFITEATQATVHAYTGIAFDGTTLTISEAHTLAEVYDWTQDYLSLNPTVDEFFATIDGINYTSTKDIVVDTGIALTGGGTVTVATGKTFTETGTYDGMIIDDNHTKGKLQTSALSGHTVAVYDNAGVEQDYQASVTGVYSYYPAAGATGTWTIVIKKPGYKGVYLDWTPTASTLTSFVPSMPQDLQPTGEAMYTGTSGALCSVTYDGTTEADIVIGNGQVSAQLAYDTVETSLITHDGMAWLAGEKSNTSIATLVAGFSIFMTSGWRLKGLGLNSTVLAFVYSTDGVVVSTTSAFPVAFLSSASLTAKQVWDYVESQTNTAGSIGNKLRNGANASIANQ